MLSSLPPDAGSAKFVDSPFLSRAGGNPYQEIEEWEVQIATLAPPFVSCSLASLGPLHVRLGLRNSDDQATNFDLKAELYLDQGSGPVPLATAEQRCIKGLTRNPDLSREIIAAFSTPPQVVPAGHFVLKLYARIGTPQSTCGGHVAATGLRLYYDSADRDSRFDMVAPPS